jgi:hypothetical protein
MRIVAFTNVSPRAHLAIRQLEPKVLHRSLEPATISVQLRGIRTRNSNRDF